MSKNIFALDKDIGSRAISDKSAYIGEGNTLELDKTKQLYWKPIDIGSWSVTENSNNSWSNENPIFSFGVIQEEGYYMDLPFKRGDICYLSLQTYADGKTVTGYVKITEAISTKLSDDASERIEYGILKWEALTYFPPEQNVDPDTSPPYSTSYSFIQVTPYYPFENLAFSYDSTGTKLTNLYYYQDEWGNKCYSVYDSRSNNGKYWPNYKANENTSGELLADDPLWTALRIEAAQHLSWTVENDELRRSYTEGTNALNVGQQNIAFSNNAHTFGEKNLSLQKGACTIGSRNFVRSIDSAAIGLNNIVTGRYAVALNEGGKALGYGSLTFGDHCKALDYYDVAGGFKSVAKGNTSFAFGRNVIASGLGSVAFGHFTIADGKRCVVGGNRNECYGNYSFVMGLENIVKGSLNIVGGEKNKVDGDASIIGGISNVNTGNWGLIVGTKNNLAGNNSAVIGADNTNNSKNGSFVGGQSNTNEGERSSIIGGSNNYISAAAADSLAFGGNIKIAKQNSIAIGTAIKSDHIQCWSIGRNLKTSGDRQMILGIGNEEDSNAMLIIGAGSNNDTDTNAKRLNALIVRQFTGNVEIPKPVLISPSGNKFLLKVSDNGSLSAERM